MLSILFGLLLGLFIYYKILKLSKYWEDRNVPNEPAWPIVGNMASAILRQKHAKDITTEIYNKHPNQRYVGLLQFTRPMLMIRDLELIKQLTIRDFDHFHDRFPPMKVSEDDLVLSKSLVSLSGREWREMRATLSPVFTTSKMRSMFQLISDCAESFVGHFKGKEPVAIEMKEILSRFATDVIASTAFGIRVDSLEEPNNKFFAMGRRTNRGVLAFFKMILMQKIPSLAKVLGSVFPKDMTIFFRSIIKDNIDRREKFGIVRPDLIHLLMEARKGQLKHESSEGDKDGFATVEESHIGRSAKHIHLTDDDIVAQAMLFFLAGFDTVSTASSFMAYELATNPEIHGKLQLEIDSVNQSSNGKVGYETLLSMKYLDQVVCETLRLWPPGFQVDRSCTKEYKISPKYSNESETLVEKGAFLLIPIIAIHTDPRYFVEPYRFDPERFSDENKAKIQTGSYLPFGIGPRNCIGSRFALLEIKTLFFHLLSKFDIVPIDETQIPLKVSKKQFNMVPERGVKLGFRPRKGK